MAKGVPKQAIIQAKVSTDRSDEDLHGPGSTLSLPIVPFYPFWPDCLFVAMNYRSNGLRLGLGWSHAWKLSGEWLCFEPHGQSGPLHGQRVRPVSAEAACGQGVPRVDGWVLCRLDMDQYIESWASIYRGLASLMVPRTIKYWF